MTNSIAQSTDEQCSRVNLHIQTVFIGLWKKSGLQRETREPGNEQKQACIRMIMIECESKH